MKKEIIIPDNAPDTIGPYSPAVKAGGFLFTSGQVAIDPITGKGVHGTVAEETRAVMENLKNLVESAGVCMDDIVKTTCYLSDINNFAAFNSIYGKYFTPGKYPARSTIETGALPAGFKVEIDAIVKL
ncbi:MAG: Rid family detoxifying hydrolase [bacterium]